MTELAEKNPNQVPKPKVPEPEISPPHRREIQPPGSPTINPQRHSDPGQHPEYTPPRPSGPEISPTRSPDATPPSTPSEVPPISS